MSRGRGVGDWGCDDCPSKVECRRRCRSPHRGPRIAANALDDRDRSHRSGGLDFGHRAGVVRRRPSRCCPSSPGAARRGPRLRGCVGGQPRGIGLRGAAATLSGGPERRVPVPDAWSASVGSRPAGWGIHRFSGTGGTFWLFRPFQLFRLASIVQSTGGVVATLMQWTSRAAKHSSGWRRAALCCRLQHSGMRHPSSRRGHRGTGRKPMPQADRMEPSSAVQGSGHVVPQTGAHIKAGMISSTLRESFLPERSDPARAIDPSGEQLSASLEVAEVTGSGSAGPLTLHAGAMTPPLHTNSSALASVQAGLSAFKGNSASREAPSLIRQDAAAPTSREYLAASETERGLYGSVLPGVLGVTAASSMPFVASNSAGAKIARIDGVRAELATSTNHSEEGGQSFARGT